MKYLHLYSLPVIILCLLFNSCSSDSPSESNSGPTMIDQLQMVLDSNRETYMVNGISVAIKIPGQESILLTSGTSEESVPINSDMIFSMASVTKTFTATLVLLLNEEGLLTLDDPLSRWLPDYPNIDNTITIRQLLNHTSGIYDFTWHPDHFNYIIFPEMRKSWTADEILNSFVLEPAFAPGSALSYSNTNYIILGKIIEEATGSQVSTELRNRIYSPLGLTSVFLPAEETIGGTCATPWEDLDQDGVCENCTDYQTVFGSFLWTCGALYSTVEDLAIFSDALFSGSILSQTSLTEMLSFHSGIYGLGVSRYDNTLFDGREAIGHDGGGIGYVARMAYFRESGISFSMMTNHRTLGPDYLDNISQALMSVVFNYFE